MVFAQIVLAGLAIGSVYALIAGSFSVVYSSNGFVSFAIGAQGMLAGYIAYVFLPQSWPGILRLVMAGLAMGILAVLTWTLLYQRVFRRNHTAAVILSLGVSLLVEEIVIEAATTTTRPATSPFGAGATRLGDLTMSAHALGSIATMAVVAALLFVLLRSSLGKVIRAMFDDAEMTEVLGVRVSRVTVGLVFASGLLSGLGGALIGPLLSLEPHMGLSIMLAGFVAAIVGGMRNIWASVLGGLVLGIAQGLFAGYVSTAYQVTAVYVALVVVLLTRPAGLFARRDVSRV